MVNQFNNTPQRKSCLIVRSPIRTFVAQDAPVSRLPVADNRNSWAILNHKKSRLFLQFNISSEQNMQVIYVFRVVRVLSLHDCVLFITLNFT